jgi:hypothetical protein
LYFCGVLWISTEVRKWLNKGVFRS